MHGGFEIADLVRYSDGDGPSGWGLITGFSYSCDIEFAVMRWCKTSSRHLLIFNKVDYLGIPCGTLCNPVKVANFNKIKY